MITDAQIEAARAVIREDQATDLSPRIIRAALEAAERAAWRDIATAPKDGTMFHGLEGNDLIAIFWHDGFQRFVSDFRRIVMAEGYTIDGKPYQDHSPTVHSPLWWRPLPQPPGEEETR